MQPKILPAVGFPAAAGFEKPADPCYGSLYIVA
jgi:hypothetical protein